MTLSSALFQCGPSSYFQVFGIHFQWVSLQLNVLDLNRLYYSVMHIWNKNQIQYIFIWLMHDPNWIFSITFLEVRDGTAGILGIFCIFWLFWLSVFLKTNAGQTVAISKKNHMILYIHMVLNLFFIMETLNLTCSIFTSYLLLSSISSIIIILLDISITISYLTHSRFVIYSIGFNIFLTLFLYPLLHKLSKSNKGLRSILT